MSSELWSLRARAEAKLTGSTETEADRELSVHKVELELQNEELREAHSRLRRSYDDWLSLFDLSPVGFVTLSDQGLILGANTRAIDLLGSSDLAGRPLAGFLAPGPADQLHVHLQSAFSTGVRTECELMVGAAPARIVSTTTTDGRCLTAIIDLTERQKAELGMRRHEARLAAILETGPDAIVTITPDGTILTANGAAAMIFGLTPSELVGRSIDVLAEDARRSLAAGDHFETVGRHREGGAFPLEVRAGEVPFEGEHIRVLFLRDVSLLRDRERKLAEALTRFRLIAEQIEDVFYVLDATTHDTMYVSPSFEGVFGRKRRPDIKEYAEWVIGEDRERFDVTIANFQRGDPLDVEYRIQRPNGEVVTIHDRAFHVERHGLITGVVRDVTEERRLQRHLARAQKLEAVGTLTAGIAHDFNNLLMGLGGCAFAALRRLEPEHPARASVEEILDASQRGAVLTRHILEFTRKRSPRTGAIDVDRVVSGSRRLLQSLLRDDVVIELDVNSGVRVLAEAGEIEQVLINLAKNGQDAMPAGGRLQVRTRSVELERAASLRLGLAEGRYALITVADAGHGMDQKTLARAFEPFFTTKGPGKGTGLGLATTFGIVRSLQGHIDVISSKGGGATFSIHLPVTNLARPTLSTPGQVRGGRILVVEDDALVLRAVQGSLEELGMEVIAAQGPAEAERLMEEAPVDRALIDVMMPHMRGDQLARVLRARHPGLRVVFMSAHSKAWLIEHGHLTQEDLLLEKPFGAEQISVLLA